MIVLKVCWKRSGFSTKLLWKASPVLFICLMKTGIMSSGNAYVVMPGMNGTELSKTLTSQCPGLKTLFISGYTSDFIGHNAFFNEGVNFITKPFGIKMLMKSVQDILNNQVC